MFRTDPARPRSRLLRTTAFRAALSFAVLFSVLSGSGLAFIHWSTARHVEAQVDARLQLETNVLLQHYRSRALPALVQSVQQRSREDGGRSLFFYLVDGPDRQPVAGLPSRWPQGLEAGHATLSLAEVFPERAADADGADRVRVLATPLGGGYRLLVGRDLNEERQLLRHTLSVAGGVTGALFLLALGASVWFGAGALRRIDAVSRTAHDIMGGEFGRRLPVTGRDDEFDELGRELNAMLDRIQQLMDGLRQVSDNVAHDLRSPLSRLRNRLEITLLEARSGDEYRAVLEQAIQDVDELLKTFNALLSIAQAEAGVSREHAAPVDLAALAEDLADLYGAAAEERGLRLETTIAAGVQVSGNRRLLTQAVANLLENAVKYTPPGGRIHLAVERTGAGARLTVADNGSGIPAAERQRVLERFVRLDSARSTPGNGLGLSLVRAVARLHNAELRLEDNHPGLRVVLAFGAGSPPGIAARADEA